MILVLNTVIKMQKNEFCLNFYTAVLNTNLDYADNYIISDCNAFLNQIKTGLANGNALNKPDNKYWYEVKNIAQSVNSLTQLAFPISTDSGVPICYRHRQNSKWGIWNRLVSNSDLPILTVRTGTRYWTQAVEVSGQKRIYFYNAVFPSAENMLGYVALTKP